MLKVFEVRDRATFIPVIAFKVGAQNDAERYLLARAGYGQTVDVQSNYVFATRATGGNCTYDYHNWETSRTMTVAHRFIKEKWDELEGGEVIDVEYLMGEKNYIATPECMETL